MHFRDAQVEDISNLHEVRISVKENMLPDPGLIRKEDYEEFLTHRGKGWLCEIDREITGFAIVDLKKNNVWALFVKPEYERQGIGKKLHELMLDWYFSQTKEKIWLGTGPDTRAEIFYRNAGWKESGKRPNGEILFEMSFEDWERIFQTNNGLNDQNLSDKNRG